MHGSTVAWKQLACFPEFSRTLGDLKRDLIRNNSARVRGIKTRYTAIDNWLHDHFRFPKSLVEPLIVDRSGVVQLVAAGHQKDFGRSASQVLEILSLAFRPRSLLSFRIGCSVGTAQDDIRNPVAKLVPDPVGIRATAVFDCIVQKSRDHLILVGPVLDCERGHPHGM